jgi:hypothetical protein
MRGDERIDDQQAEFVFLDCRNDGVDDRPRDDRAGSGLLGDYDFRLAPGVDEEPSVNLVAADSMR